MSRSQKWKDEWAFSLMAMEDANMLSFADAVSMTVSRVFTPR